MYNKELIKQLIVSNPTLNNVEISKLYNKIELTNHNPELMRKSIRKLREKTSIPNPGNSKSQRNSLGMSYHSPSMPDENTKKVDVDKGTFTSTVDSMFDPKDDIELAILHRIDLTKYKISSYWSKLKSNGKFTSSVNCTLRRLGDSVSLDEIKEALSEVINSKKIVVKDIPLLPSNNDKALIVWVSDEHVGAAVENELYSNEWNEKEYFYRKNKIVETIRQQAGIHGNFDRVIVCTLGDTLDGYSGQTTRGGHNLPQNMTNKEAIKTYVEVNKYVWDEIISLRIANNYDIYNVENSNHGGLGFDAAANYVLETYLKTKYPKFNFVNFEKIIDSFTYGTNAFHLTHGKDDIHMKRNFPLFLNDKTENFIKEYMDQNGFKDESIHQSFVKGDLHQFATQQGKFCSYTNIPSLFGSSGWSMANFGKGKAGFCYSVVPKNSNEFTFTPVWFK